ncbi:MAG TPA: aspartate aminotransferase family protein [Ktedonobacteraceae bacterium]|nr:aspartate aminotransferase family protein [Ktedonobacteraceae bacterium]
MLREPITISRTLVGEIVAREDAEFGKRTPRSQEIFERAKKTLPLGVASSFQAVPPYPMTISRGVGSHIWDYDGNDHIDFHLGFGSLLVGHSHPVLVKALQEQLEKGSLYSLPSADTVFLAEELVRRFAPLEQVRFCNSGTEATMDALRLARAYTKRDKVVKIEGSYHGHHDTVMMSTKPSREAAGPAERPNTVPASTGIPGEVKGNVIIAPYNDPDALEQILSEHEGEVAAIITEAVLMNVGIMLPDEGYLQAVRDITRRHGVLLVFDEVKTGVTVAPGGITELYPVEPDLICLAKSIGGGMPIGAFGGREEIMRHINHSEVLHLGTFNGNPMSMKAGLVTLTQLFTPEAHAHAIALSKRLADGYRSVIDEYEMPMHVAQIGAKGCAMFRHQQARNYRAWWEIDMDLSYAYWLFLANRGILFPPGLDDQWTISIQHSEQDIDRHLSVFREFVSELHS